MPLVDMRDMLRHARGNGYAVGAFDVYGLPCLEGVIRAAERAHAPVILSLPRMHALCYDAEIFLPAVEAAARRTEVPVALELAGAADTEEAVAAIRLGCNALGVAACGRSAESAQRARAVVSVARGCGVPVQAELPTALGSAEAVAEARAFVERTGIDVLGVEISAIDAAADRAALERLQAALDLPLAVQARPDWEQARYAALAEHGVAKVRWTALAETEAAARACAGGLEAAVEAVRSAVSGQVEQCLRRFGAAGRAAEARARCRAWDGVEHIIVYNVDGLSGEEVDDMMAEGRRVLGAIPGVREIFTGRALRDGARYGYCWRVRFAHPAVIDSYREHPQHVAFADKRFRPVAADRLTIDYEPA